MHGRGHGKIAGPQGGGGADFCIRTPRFLWTTRAFPLTLFPSSCRRKTQHTEAKFSVFIAYIVTGSRSASTPLAYRTGFALIMLTPPKSHPKTHRRPTRESAFPFQVERYSGMQPASLVRPVSNEMHGFQFDGGDRVHLLIPACLHRVLVDDGLQINVVTNVTIAPPLGFALGLVSDPADLISVGH
ncbi:hypothetical protein BDZ89DRAFT_1138054 [Hymenopellis radicata]|nr:hypothetical protein BDZ89DRAFT_1138054 [Hymenopellis radicata]